MPLPLSPLAAFDPRHRVTSAIASAASATGVNFDYLLNQAKIESGLNPDVQARTSSASGLYQFTRQSWLATLKQHGAEHDLGWAANAITKDQSGRYAVADPRQREEIFALRDQPEAAAAMAAELAADNESFLTARLDRAVEPVDLYLAHFLGAAGAARFLDAHAADPDAFAAPLLPAAAAANRSIFYHGDGSMRSLADIRSNFAAKLNQPAPAGTAAPPQLASQISTTRHSIMASQMQHSAMSQRPFEPMPARLSLDFARHAYQRLASLDGAYRS
jgi:hypothetical protein